MIQSLIKICKYYLERSTYKKDLKEVTTLGICINSKEATQMIVEETNKCKSYYPILE